jgi:hypothetical protein
MICGGDYTSHLELWWSKHLYSPFDQYLVKTYENALTITEVAEKQYKSSRRTTGSSASSNRKAQTSKSSSKPEVMGTPSFAFHTRYVQDVSDIVETTKDRKEQMNLIKKKLLTTSVVMPNQVYRMVKVPSTGVTYVSPSVVKGTTSYTRKEAFVDLLSVLVLGSVDDMIYVQAIENKKLSAPKSIRDRL